MNSKIPLILLSLGLASLLLGAGLGLLITNQILHPDFLKDMIAFNRLRPLHVSSEIGWIILTVIAGVYTYVAQTHNLKWRFPWMTRLHFFLLVFSAIFILFSYISGRMGGREYLTFHPLISIPIILGWLVFGIHYFSTLRAAKSKWPVYFWMWGTGIAFMIFHLCEAHLWLLPYFRSYFIRDITVQWKSYGSFFGSWNMLIYGTAIFLMAKIKNDEQVATGKMAFFFYFLGLTNLMFGWAHHTYLIPTKPWVRGIAYAISMTEWIVFIYMIMDWVRSLRAEEKQSFSHSFSFLKATDFWVFLNLFMALLMSIPTIHFYTHGTYITVAHSMGTTIGINTSILLASSVFLVSRLHSGQQLQSNRLISNGFWVFNCSFLVFWLNLIISGILKAKMHSQAPVMPFAVMQAELNPLMILFFVAGCGILVGLMMIVFPLFPVLVRNIKKSEYI